MRIVVPIALACACVIGGALAALRPPPPPASPAVPDGAETALTWRNGTMVLRLTEEACPHRELAHNLEHEGIPPARVYVMEQGGRRTLGCWAPDYAGDVLTRAPDGSDGFVPLTWFQREPQS